MRFVIIWAAMFACCAAPRTASAQPVQRGAAPTTKPVSPAGFREASPGVFALGQVTLRKADRTVSFPVQINQRSNVVEYAVVTSAGKTHESLFKTEADPVHVHLAMLLLGARPASSNVLGGDVKTAPTGQLIHIEARWQDAGRQVSRPLESLVVYSTNRQQTLPPGAWLYNGSYMDRGGFMATMDGSIVSLQEDAAALANNPRPDRFFDDLHVVNTTLLPPAGVPIEMFFSLTESAGAGTKPPAPR